MKSQTSNYPIFLAMFMSLSWLGMVIHNLAEFPNMPLYRPEYLFPTLVGVVLLVAWWRQPGFRRFWTWLIFVWSGLHFAIGGILSVIPLAIWPFVPEQSLSHYLAHLAYSVLQAPILILLWRSLQSSHQGQPFTLVGEDDQA